MFKFSSDNKRYHTLSYHNNTCGCKTYKAAIDAGFTCPNVDGTKGVGGCIFCDSGSHCFACDSALSVTEQLERESRRIRQRNPGVGLTAYFQAGSNTYAAPDRVRALLTEALRFPGVVALSVATRPDCIDEEILELLTEFAEKAPLTVELGLQTVHDKTAEKINRCYPFTVFSERFKRLKSKGIRICVHIINGLPGETAEDMRVTALTLGKLKPDGVKIHLLHVLRETAMADMYQSGMYMPLTLMEYVSIVVSQLERIPAETVIERITGDGDKSRLLAPLWSKDKIRVLGTIDKCLAEQKTWQGRLSLAKNEDIVYNEGKFDF